MHLKDQKVIVDLKIPRYSNSGEIEEYLPYEFNGTYKIEKQGQV